MYNVLELVISCISFKQLFCDELYTEWSAKCRVIVKPIQLQVTLGLKKSSEFNLQHIGAASKLITLS